MYYVPQWRWQGRHTCDEWSRTQHIIILYHMIILWAHDTNGIDMCVIQNSIQLVHNVDSLIFRFYSFLFFFISSSSWFVADLSQNKIKSAAHWFSYVSMQYNIVSLDVMLTYNFHVFDRITISWLRIVIAAMFISQLGLYLFIYPPTPMTANKIEHLPDLHYREVTFKVETCPKTANW